MERRRPSYKEEINQSFQEMEHEGTIFLGPANSKLPFDPQAEIQAVHKLNRREFLKGVAAGIAFGTAGTGAVALHISEGTSNNNGTEPTAGEILSSVDYDSYQEYQTRIQGNSESLYFVRKGEIVLKGATLLAYPRYYQGQGDTNVVARDVYELVRNPISYLQNSPHSAQQEEWLLYFSQVGNRLVCVPPDDLAVTTLNGLKSTTLPHLNCVTDSYLQQKDQQNGKMITTVRGRIDFEPTDEPIAQAYPYTP